MADAEYQAKVNLAAATHRLGTRAREIFPTEVAEAFIERLAETYNACDPDNDWDLDIDA